MIDLRLAREVRLAHGEAADSELQVEHPFHVIKNLFRHKKVRYKGLVKNEAQLFSLFGLANLAPTRHWHAHMPGVHYTHPH